MTFDFFVAHAAALYWIMSLSLLVISIIATILQPLLAERRAQRTDQPAVSIVLPVKILEDSFDATQESAFTQRYDHIDVTVATDDLDTPAVAHMRHLFSKHPHIQSRILKSTAKFAASPKVDNLYAPFMQDMLGFRWRDLATIYLRSLIVTAAAVAPALIGYRLLAPPAEAGALQMLGSAGMGALLWFAALRLAGHPLFAEILGLLGEIVDSLRQRRIQPATP